MTQLWGSYASTMSKAPSRRFSAQISCLRKRVSQRWFVSVIQHLLNLDIGDGAQVSMLAIPISTTIPLAGSGTAALAVLPPPRLERSSGRSWHAKCRSQSANTWCPGLFE